jgi:EmrB/QacA subfamily drug resistance transporter
MAATGQRTNYKVTFTVISAGVAAYALLQSLVLPVLPTIQHDLHTTQNTVTWVLTAYLLSASVFTPILGRIGDMYGKERMFVVCLAALSLGSLLAALAPSIGVMIIARAIQGLGGGALPLAFGIIRDEFPGDRVAGAVGIIAALTAVGGGLALVLAGPIVNALNYHWLFWIPMIITAAAAVASQILVPESPNRSPGRISWLSALSLSAWLIALLVAVSEASVWGWLSGKVIGLLVLSVIVAVAWVYIELKAASPLVDMRMMRVHTVWTINLVSFLIGVTLYSIFAFIPEFLQTPKIAGYGFGASITESGLIILPMSAFMFIFGSATGALSQRFGARNILILGSVISIIPFAILTFAHSHIWEILVAMSVLGVGFALAFATMSGIVVAAVAPEQTGIASGMNANIRTIGGAIGGAIMSSIVTSGAHSNGLPVEAGYTHGFAFLGIAAVASAVACVLVPRLSQGSTPAMNHPELAVVAAGTLSGDESE